MNKDCEAIQKVIDAIEKGANADDVIPYDLSHYSKDCYRELLMIYIKYGNDINRIDIAKNKLREV